MIRSVFCYSASWRYKSAANTGLQTLRCHPFMQRSRPHRFFLLNTPVNKIAVDPRGKAILERDVPKLLSNRNHMVVNDMSLSQIASLSCGRLAATRLDQVEC